MIKLDTDDIKVSCLNIHSNQLPEDMYEDLCNRFKVWPEYFDQGDMKEHMFTTEDVREGFKENGIARWSAWIDDIEYEMARNNCAYFRVIKDKS